ncbi:hypothetical protein [Nocardioides jejuensis]|uniref:DUF2336 domain-containing protein n=1 Tax=Nocardioides jejuensis TaxID=2502782 RepID=A0A4R1CIC8_9ACTN|nr:hypothetical protein [Nocardioides jejuensis]TCJ29886.1 hypothetical protein EPD65_06190 [Nocardioides jejuensis]
MTSSEVRVELTRLASLLGCAEDALEFLEGQSHDALKELRDKLTDRLFDANRDVLLGLAKTTKIVPGGVAAKIATMAFPPQLAARVAGVMETDAAVSLASRVPLTFLADLAPKLDPRRVTPILEKLPPQLLVDAGQILGERGEYIAMADFVGVLPDAQIQRTLGVLSDEALVRTGQVIEDPARVARILEMLPHHRLQGVVETAAKLGEWDAVRRAQPHFSDATRTALRAIADDLGVEVPADLR